MWFSAMIARASATGRVQVGEQGIGLEHHGDAPPGRRQGGHVLAADQDAPGAYALQAGDHAQRRRLAAARGAEQHEETALGRRQADVVDRPGFAPDLRYAIEKDLRHACPLLPLETPAQDTRTARRRKGLEGQRVNTKGH
jgi:hypothetical protein